MTRGLIVALSALILLTACEEDKCNRTVTDSANYQAAFDHCMEKAALIAKSGNHDNSYNTVEECQSYAMRIDAALCKEKRQ